MQHEWLWREKASEGGGKRKKGAKKAARQKEEILVWLLNRQRSKKEGRGEKGRRIEALSGKTATARVVYELARGHTQA